jgi:hypothetical protein
MVLGSYAAPRHAAKTDVGAAVDASVYRLAVYRSVYFAAAKRTARSRFSRRPS